MTILVLLKVKKFQTHSSSLVLFVRKGVSRCKNFKAAVPWAWSSLLHTSFPPLLAHCRSFHILLYFHLHHGQPNTFIIFCSTNKAVHWSEALTPHNDPLSESHCSYTQDNYSTLQLERGNYWERCSSRVSREEKRGLGQGSCGCIVYWGRRSNKGAQLRQDAGWKMWCGDTNAEDTLVWPSRLFYCLKCPMWDRAATVDDIFFKFKSRQVALVSFCPVFCQAIQAIVQTNKNTWGGWTTHSASRKTKWSLQHVHWVL